MALLSTPAWPQVGAAVWRLGGRSILSIGSLDGSGPDMFSRIAGAVRLSSGAVLVVDAASKEVRLFSANGRSLRVSGRFGGGPGEFRTVAAVRRCAGDSTMVYDTVLRRISMFTPAGALARVIDIRQWSEEGLAPYDVDCNAAGDLGFVHRSAAPPAGIGPRRPHVAITVVGRDGAEARLGMFPGSERYFFGVNDSPRPLGKETVVALASHAVYVGTGDTFEILKFSLRGEPLGAVRAAHEERHVTREHVDLFVDRLLARRPPRVDSAKADATYRGLEYPATFPAYRRLLVDGADNLWVEEYPVPGAGRRGWRVFSDAGVMIGRLAVPGNFELVQVGLDQVLGVWRDEFDTESVRVYELVK